MNKNTKKSIIDKTKKNIVSPVKGVMAVAETYNKVLRAPMNAAKKSMTSKNTVKPKAPVTKKKAK